MNHKSILASLVLVTVAMVGGLARAQTPYARLDLVASLDSGQNMSVQQTQCLDLGGYVLAFSPYDAGLGSVDLELQDQTGPPSFVLEYQSPVVRPFVISVRHDPPCVELVVDNGRVRIYKLTALVDWTEGN